MPHAFINVAVSSKIPGDITFNDTEFIFDETGKPVTSAQASTPGEKRDLSEEELRKLSAFTDFVNTLDLQGLDKGKPEDK